MLIVIAITLDIYTHVCMYVYMSMIRIHLELRARTVLVQSREHVSLGSCLAFGCGLGCRDELFIALVLLRSGLGYISFRRFPS